MIMHQSGQYTVNANSTMHVWVLPVAKSKKPGRRKLSTKGSCDLTSNFTSPIHATTISYLASRETEILAIKLEILRTNEPRTQLIEKFCGKKLFICSLIYCKTAVFWGWVPIFLSPVSLPIALRFCCKMYIMNLSVNRWTTFPGVLSAILSFRPMLPAVRFDL